MRWTALFFLMLAGALATPVLGTVVALIIALVTLPLIAPVLKVLEPVTRYLMDNGMRGGFATIASASLIIVPLAALCLFKGLRRGLTAHQRRRWFHGLIWIGGLPAIIALAWWILPDKFG